jgi:CRP-like cAMP-binding protein
MATNTDAKLDLLRRVPLFSDLDKKALLAVGQLADEIDVAAGRDLVKEGEHAREFFVIVEGSVRIEREGSTVATLGPGDFFGEIALVDGGTRTATATTEAPSKLLLVGHREFHSLMEMNPSVQSCVLMALARRVRNLDPIAE